MSKTTKTHAPLPLTRFITNLAILIVSKVISAKIITTKNVKIKFIGNKFPNPERAKIKSDFKSLFVMGVKLPFGKKGKEAGKIGKIVFWTRKIKVVIIKSPMLIILKNSSHKRYTPNHKSQQNYCG